MRRQFYWNLYDPYFTNTNGNTRLDLFLKIQVIAHFYRQIFPIPEINNQLSLKLEDLVSNLSIDTENAHDALADCEFLIHLMKTIAQKLPNYYKEIIETTSKEGFFKKLNSNKVHFNCYYIPRSKIIKTYKKKYFGANAYYI